MSGGLPFRTPFGTIYSTNITPDPLTGIGNWSEIDFLNSLRHGVRPGGDHLYPAFPYTAYTKASDDDILAMFAYLKSINPVRISPPQNELVFPFNYRPLMAFWKLLYFQPGVYEVREDESEQWNRALIWSKRLLTAALVTRRATVWAQSGSLPIWVVENFSIWSPDNTIDPGQLPILLQRNVASRCGQSRTWRIT